MRFPALRDLPEDPAAGGRRPPRDAAARTALRFPDGSLTYAELRGAAAALAAQLDAIEPGDGAERVGSADAVPAAERAGGDARVGGDERMGVRDPVAVWATPSLATCVALVGALLAGRAVVPLNPKAGAGELAHVVRDSDPALVLCGPGAELPAALAGRPRLEVDTAAAGGALPPEPDGERPALVLYTSGTTGPPKGAVLPRRALAANLDALADAWQWSADDEVVHALPLFHAHGLVLATLGPLHHGGTTHHLGRFDAGAVAAALDAGATMLFAVPTMYHRLAAAAERDPALARSVGRARLLVSGSAALPAAEHARIERFTGQRIVERYGMTETLMTVAVRAAGERRAGYVGLPLDGVDVRLVDDEGAVIEGGDDETVGELQVRGPSLFLGYLNGTDATVASFAGDWFRTGDLATRAADGYIRIVGRRSTDLIKSGGFRIGAGEIEGALLEHPAVAEAAVTGAPDPDLGERIVAWLVLRPGAEATADELIEHVARFLTPHKRPREVRFLAALPRNELGKVQKRRLPAA